MFVDRAVQGGLVGWLDGWMDGGGGGGVSVIYVHTHRSPPRRLALAVSPLNQSGAPLFACSCQLVRRRQRREETAEAEQTEAAGGSPLQKKKTHFSVFIGERWKDFYKCDIS